MLGNIVAIIIVFLFLLGSISMICSILFDPSPVSLVVKQKKEPEVLDDLIDAEFMEDDIIIDEDLVEE